MDVGVKLLLTMRVWMTYSNFTFLVCKMIRVIIVLLSTLQYCENIKDNAQECPAQCLCVVGHQILIFAKPNI